VGETSELKTVKQQASRRIGAAVPFSGMQLHDLLFGNLIVFGNTANQHKTKP